MAYFHTGLKHRLFESKNTNQKLLTAVSVYGWSYMAKLHKFEVNNLILT